MIIIQPSGGLCNRMRVISSAYVLAQKKNCKLLVLWKMCDELNCPFEELFLPPEEFTIINFKSNFNIKKLFYQFRAKQRFHNVDIENNKTDGVLHKEFFEKLASSVYISTWEHFYPAQDYHLFVPTKELQQRIKNITDTFGSHCVGVHIRRTDHPALSLRLCKAENDGTAHAVILTEHSEWRDLPIKKNAVISTERRNDSIFVI